MTRYRYPSEQWILAATILAIMVVVLIAAGITLFLVPIFFVLFVGIAFYMNYAHHQELMRQAFQVTRQSAPELAEVVQDCVNRLRPRSVQVFVVNANERNAYTFGVTNPKVIVLYRPLLEIMDEAELRFIIGHEMGHVALGHTWLNSLLGGMAGVPVSLGAAVILNLAFRWWNRACEYSADRAGLIACGDPQKAILALLELAAGDIQSSAQYQRALALIEREDDSVGNVLLETLSTHPMIVRRIEQIRRFAASEQYRRLRQA